MFGHAPPQARRAACSAGRARACSVPPTRCVLVEDTLAAPEGGTRRLGMHAVWMQRYLERPLPRALAAIGDQRRRAVRRSWRSTLVRSPRTCMPKSSALQHADARFDDPSCRPALRPVAADDSAEDAMRRPHPTHRPVALPPPCPRRPASARSRASAACRSCRRWPAMLAAARRRAHHDRGARGEARCLRGGALPPLREQGADVRGPDRVHRAERLHARQPDRRARAPTPARRCSKILDRAAPVRREEPGHDARHGRRCAGVRERAPARAHEPVLRPHRVAAAPEPARCRPRHAGVDDADGRRATRRPRC